MEEVVARRLIEQPTLVVRGTRPVAGIPEFLGGAFHAVAVHAAAKSVDIVGRPFARHRKIDEYAVTFEIEAGFPVGREVDGAPPVVASLLPAGPAAVIVHIGPYETMEPTYATLAAWIAERGASPLGPAWEVYYSDPAEEPDPATWRTEIVQPYEE